LGLAALVIGFGLIVGAAWLAAASLRLRHAADFLLAVYLFSTAGVILSVLVLSPFALVTRGGVLVASAGAVGAAAAVWHSRGRPATPSMQIAASAAWAALRDPLLTMLAVAVALGLAYAATLAIATPANEFDVLWYHLPRAALWTQEHGVHYIEHANTTRLNENPPGAEILSAWAMTLEGSDRFASIFQVVALAATILAITRIARLLGFSNREAAFGALLFATLPVVALQAATALNDIVMTSFVVAVVAFMLCDTGAALGLGGLALALSVATKGTAVFTVPMLLVIAAILVPRRRWLSVGVAGGVSIAAGACWYVFHYFEAGGVAGDEQEAILNRGSESTPSTPPAQRDPTATRTPSQPPCCSCLPGSPRTEHGRAPQRLPALASRPSSFFPSHSRAFTTTCDAATSMRSSVTRRTSHSSACPANRRSPSRSRRGTAPSASSPSS
jgi:Dolichyl-phosphate-mannose-protein mannosyltransferase